jgi:hypothetical protein
LLVQRDKVLAVGRVGVTDLARQARVGWYSATTTSAASSSSAARGGCADYAEAHCGVACG